MEAAGSSREQEEQKPKNRVPFYKLFSFADFWDYVLMALGSFAAIVHGVSVPVWFIFFGKLINSLGLAYLDPPAAAKTVARYSWDFVYLALVMMASSWAEVACWMQSGERQVTRIRLAYLRAILNRDISYFDAESFSGEVVSAITADILIVQDAISEKVGNFLHYFSRFVAGFAIGFATIWQLSLVTLSIVPAIAISGGLHAFLLINLTAKTRKAYVRAGGIAEEVIGNVRTVYAFVGEEKAVSRYKNALKDTYYLGKKSGLAKGFGLGCMYGILFLCWALLVWYTARLVHRGLINGGEAFTTMLNVVIAGLALGQSAPDLGAFTRARGAAYSIFHMIEQSKESVLRSSSNSSGGGLTLKIVEGNVEFKNVCFSYPSRPDIPIFENLNFHIPAGQVVAIVGGSGSGKSTVISLIERFYDPTSGQVLFDNYDLKSFDLKWLRRQIGLVNQEPVLFACSIRENILYGKEDATMTEITQAAKLAHADSFISALPNRYETQVGERGIQMSGGQKQRIAIARAMVKNPSILLLDEATSALDAESEKSVQEALDRVLAGRTTVIVAHRLSTIKSADIIAVVQDGKIVEMGDHKSLISKEGGAYAALVKLQESGGIDKASQEFGSARHSHSMQNRLSSQRTMSFGAASIGSDRGSSRRFGSELDDRDLDMGLTPKKKVPFSRLVKIAAPEWMYAIPAVFGAISAGSLTPLFGLGITQAMVYLYTEDEATSSRNIGRISFFFVGGAGASLVCNVVSHFDWGVIGESLTLRVREMMFAALLRTEVGWFDEDNNNSGSLASRLASDATMVRGLVVDRTAIFIHNISLVSTAFLIAFLEQWKLALVILAVYPLLVAAQMAERYFMVGFGGNLSKAYLKANMVAAESVSNIRTVAAFCAEDKVVETFYKALEEPRKRSFARGQVAGICYGITQFMMFSSYGLALWYASTLIKHYEASFGSVIKTFMVLIVSALIVAETLAVCPDLIKAANAVDSVFEIVDRQTQILPDDPAAEDVKTVQGNIELKHVNFSYPSRPDIAIFEDFNLKVKAGYSMALVGSSGSGKSSVISLILRFYEPTAGTVLVDGKDIRKLKLRSLRRHIGLVQQEPALFSTTIYENILYGKDGATEAEVIEAAKLANAHGFISSLPAGYHTEVGERGVQLSGGQKQRVAIARAVLKDPSILLLDEATSALDAESERVVQDALNRLMKNRTTVMIAHRLSTVQNADVISVLQNGKIVEQGTHSSLVSNPNSAYSKLIRLQNSSAAAASQIDSGT